MMYYARDIEGRYICFPEGSPIVCTADSQDGARDIMTEYLKQHKSAAAYLMIFATIFKASNCFRPNDECTPISVDDIDLNACSPVKRVQLMTGKQLQQDIARDVLKLDDLIKRFFTFESSEELTDTIKQLGEVGASMQIKSNEYLFRDRHGRR